MKTKPTLPWQTCQFMALEQGGQSVTDLDVGHETLVLREVVDESLQSAANHGVLAHENDALTAEGLSDLVHLLRGDIVDGDNEDALVLLEERLELIEVDSLGFFFAPHFLRF